MTLTPALGFVSRPIDGGGTLTLTTCVGQFLRDAERLAGPRDPSWTFLGIEIFGEECEGARPHTWYPGNCGNIAIRLTRDVANNPARALFQLAHEVCHLISPSGNGIAPALEEGFATYFAHHIAPEYGAIQCPVSSAYRAAYTDAAALLMLNPHALRDIRRLEPRLLMVTPQTVLQAVPSVARPLPGTLIGGHPGPL